MSDLRESLESMVWQYGFRGVRDGKPVIHTGDMSALEEAFEALGWEDPHPVPDVDGLVCDVEGCMEPVSDQGYSWSWTGYWMVCGNHSEGRLVGKGQPEMKRRAVQRENSRDANGYLPSVSEEKKLSQGGIDGKN